MRKIVMVNIRRLFQISLCFRNATFRVVQFKIRNQRLDKGIAVRQDPNPPPQRRPLGGKAESGILQPLDKLVHKQRMTPASEYFQPCFFQQTAFAQIDVDSKPLSLFPGEQRLLHGPGIARPAHVPQPGKDALPLVEDHHQPENI